MSMSLNARFQQTLRHNLVLPDRELRQVADKLVDDALDWMGDAAKDVGNAPGRDTTGDGPNGPVAQQWDR